MINIREKINKYLEKLDDKQRYYVFTGILVSIFIIDYLLIMRPQLNALSKINPEIKTLSEDFKVTKENIQKIDFYRTEVEKLKKLAVKSEQSIQNKSELPNIFQKVSSIADKKGVKIDQITPSPFDQKEILKIQNRRYISFPIKIKARSAYHNFGRFLNDLENSDIFVTVDNFSIVSSSEMRLHTIDLTISAVIYED